MVIYGVSFDMVGKQPIVLLKTADGNKFLPIWIGHPEAASILMKLQGAGEIDSRPSDAIALAVRSGAPIFAAEEVIAESAIEFEHDVEESEDVVEKFKEFLDQVTPEDFAAGEDS
jgi:bifunctional DNase/RNase